MAELYLAKDTRSSRMVVLKRILPYLAEEVEFLKMFLDEARIAAQLHHPNIVEVFELGRLDGSTFISMEWVDGIDLRKVLLKEQERGAPIPPGVGAWLIARLCEGLHHAHERPGPDGKPLGIIHRDVSPQNVMVSYRGEVKLVDFGIAKATAWMSRSKPGVIKGKFLYLAPEQLTQERLDHRADLFALGTLLYELTVGKSPFYRTTTEAVIFSIRMENPAPPETVVPDYPQTLSRIVMRCLEKDREQRFQTADEIRRALDAFIADEAPTSQGDVAAYMAGLFGDDDERTSVYLPPNAQSGVKPAPKKPGPPVPDEDDDEDRTMSIPGALSPERRAEKPPPPVPTPREDGPSTEPVRPRSPRDVQATAPIEPPTISMASMRPGDEGEETAVGRSAPTLAQVEPPNTGPTLEQRTGRPIENAASDPSISTVSQPAPRLLVPPRRPLSPPPLAEAPVPRTDETASELASVEAPVPVERPRPRRPARKEPFDVEDHIATVDMARFEDSVVVQRNRRLAVGLIVALAVAVVALLAWVFWPAPKPAPRPKPAVEKPAPTKPSPEAPPARSKIRVTFRGTPGLKLTVGDAVVAVGESLELPPGPVGVRYACPGRKKQRPRTVEFTPVIPDTADDVAVDVPACL